MFVCFVNVKLTSVCVNLPSPGRQEKGREMKGGLGRDCHKDIVRYDSKATKASSKCNSQTNGRQTWDYKGLFIGVQRVMGAYLTLWDLTTLLWGYIERAVQGESFG